MPMRYRVFGLTVEADREIPGLAASDFSGRPDLRIESRDTGSLGEEAEWRDLYVSQSTGENGLPLLRVSMLEESRFFRYLYDDGAEFHIDGAGQHIWARWPTDLTIDEIGPYITGPILGFALRLRGVTSLHASAVAVEGRALAFVGPAGTGKSTTAAAFARLGYPVLTDDIVTVTESRHGFIVHSGYPWIRLWPASAKQLFGSENALPRISPDDPSWDKRFLDLTSEGFKFAEDPLRLGALYILGQRGFDERLPAIEEPKVADKLLTMVGNTYSNYVLDREIRAREFELLGRLVRTVPVRLVVPHTSADRLTPLCEVVLEDYAALAKESATKPDRPRGRRSESLEAQPDGAGSVAN